MELHTVRWTLDENLKIYVSPQPIFILKFNNTEMKDRKDTYFSLKKNYVSSAEIIRLETAEEPRTPLWSLNFTLGFLTQAVYQSDNFIFTLSLQRWTWLAC